MLGIRANLRASAGESKIKSIYDVLIVECRLIRCFVSVKNPTIYTPPALRNQ